MCINENMSILWGIQGGKRSGVYVEHSKLQVRHET